MFFVAWLTNTVIITNTKSNRDKCVICFFWTQEKGPSRRDDMMSMAVKDDKLFSILLNRLIRMLLVILTSILILILSNILSIIMATILFIIIIDIMRRILVIILSSITIIIIVAIICNILLTIIIVIVNSILINIITRIMLNIVKDILMSIFVWKQPCYNIYIDWLTVKVPWLTNVYFILTDTINDIGNEEFNHEDYDFYRLKGWRW